MTYGARNASSKLIRWQILWTQENTRNENTRRDQTYDL
jgi:hypothetical protein